MKKIKLLFFIVAFSLVNISFSQSRTEKLSKYKIGAIDAQMSQSIKDGQDTLKYVYLGFQNAKYEHITDICSIMIANQDELDKFIKDIEGATEECLNKSTVYWEEKRYTVFVYDFSKHVYFKEGKGSGYTTLSKKQSEKLITWLKTLKF